MNEAWKILTKNSVNFENVISLQVEHAQVLKEGHALSS